MSAATISLLWRERRTRPGPAPRLTVDRVVAEAIALADADGLAALSMRVLARRLGVSTMTLYTSVPDKGALLDLMLDALYLGMPRAPHRGDWRQRLRAIAAANRALYRDHPWAARVSPARPPLGPGLMAKYEHELAAFDDTGLPDVEIDAALTFLLGFVQSAAIAEQDAPPGDAEWWEEVGPELARFVDPADYPRATRIGTAAGEAQGGAYAADRAYAFGLERVIDGLGALVE